MRAEGRLEDSYSSYVALKYYQDSIYKELYKNEIANQRENYRIDQLTLENSRTRAKISMILDVTSVLLFVVCLLSYYYLKNNSRKLARSQKELEKAKLLAETSIRNKSLLLSNMSHEIRTPLNALVGFSAILSSGEEDVETRKQCHEIIRLNSELLLKLINDIVGISCFDLTEMKFRIATHDIVATCRNVVETLQQIKHTAAEISFETDLTSLEIQTDNNRLQQVLINLLVNATKFTHKGSIVLHLEEEKGIARFSVTDTGCGIPREKQAHIFERFEKLDEKKQGTGLGLSICRLILERLGGRIWIDSEYTGGARFIFTHPLKQEDNR